MEDNEVFMVRRLPARLSIEQTGKLLRFHPDALDYLVDIGLLEVLGGIAPGAPKFFAAAYILQLCSDLKWLGKATQKVRQHIQKKNANQKAAKPNRVETNLQEAA